jgi:hypothetical protein
MWIRAARAVHPETCLDVRCASPVPGGASRHSRVENQEPNMSPTVDAMPGARRVPQMGFTADTSSRGTSVRRSRWRPLTADRPDRSERTLTLEIPTEPGQRRAAIDPTWGMAVNGASVPCSRSACATIRARWFDAPRKCPPHPSTRHRELTMQAKTMTALRLGWSEPSATSKTSTKPWTTCSPATCPTPLLRVLMRLPGELAR